MTAHRCRTTRSSAGSRQGPGWWRVLGVVAVAALVAAACGGDGDDDEAAPPGGREGGVRFLIAENFWADWEPYASTAASQLRLERHVYDYLVDFPDGTLGEAAPQLATDWRMIDDRTWEFDLRDDVVFHDGQPMTAEDVKASVELASGLVEETAYSLRWVPAEVEVVDDFTVRISTEEPFAPMLVQLFGTPIVSAAWLEGDPDLLASEPNGTGPFRLVEDTVERKVMDANPDYWGDPPGIERLVWEFVADPETRLNALLTGQADAIDRVPPEQLATLEAEDGIELIAATAVEQINLWVRPGRLPIWEENEHFREAMAWSIDREALVDNLVLGNSEVARSFIPSGASFFEEQEPQYTFDLEQAQAALEAGGITDGGPEFELWVAEGFLPRGPEVVEAIADGMRQVGLKPRIVTSDVAGMIDDIFSDTGSGQVYHLSWAGTGDAAAAFDVYTSAFVWNFDDPRIDDLAQQGVSTLDDDERAAAYSELQEYMWGNLPHIPLYYSDFTVAHRTELQGLLVQPTGLRTDFRGASLAG